MVDGKSTGKPEHSLLVIFGMSGDLATRKLLPALAHIAAADQLENVHILGISRRNISLPKLFAAALPRSTFKRGGKERLELATDMLQMDLSNHDDYKKLVQYIKKLEQKIDGAPLQVLYYLSVPPSASLPIIETLGAHNLCVGAKLLLEKPFGFDLQSAEETTNRINQHFGEDQIYRIDHYLAKEMAQNILVFRATNAIFSDIWNNQFIDSITITASESIGIEGRAAFYEQTGALRDIVQSHLMQLLAVTIMETPNTLDWQVLPKLRALALQQLEPISPGNSTIIRGQYDSYRQEVDNPSSQTETFVALTVFSKDPLWQGVPIRLITGKALNQKTTEIVLKFKQKHALQSNTLRLCIQPNEGVSLDLLAKRPGYEKSFENVTMSFTYGSQQAQLPDAYEQVIIDAIRSDKSLFASSDEILASWRALAPVQDYWSMHSDDMRTYHSGSTIQEVLRAAQS